MIRFLTLRNFKCIRFCRMDFAPLTVLCGANGVGKSSVIQALLIARSAGLAGKSQTSISLNGLNGLDLGTVGDILCQEPDSDHILIELETETGKNVFVGDGSRSRLENQFLCLSCDVESNSVLANPVATSFMYLSAERLGPRDTLLTQSRPNDHLDLGSRGEFVAEILARFEHQEVPQKLRHPSNDSNEATSLRQQVERWLGDWAPGIQIETKLYQGTNAVSLRFRRQDVRSEWVRPTNTGFGISHSLPIVIAGLISHAGGILIVDNPESHLHPAGQSAMGYFLATVAGAGVQVVVETHSDHILNGIRLAVMNKEHSLKAQQVTFFHLTTDTNGVPNISSISMHSDGQLSHWPKGFFDQIERDLVALAGVP